MDLGAREKHLIDILIRAENLTDPAFRKAESNVQNLGRHMRAVGGMVAGGAALYAAGVGASIIAAGSLDDKIVDSLTLIHTEGDAYENLKTRMTDSALDLSRKLGVSAGQVAEGYYQVLSTGAEALSEKFTKLTETGVKLSRTVGLDLSQSVEILNDTLNAFGPSAKTIEHVGDVLFKAAALSATTVPQLSEAMREAGPAAASVGANFEETAAILANFAQKGVKGAEAGTALRMVLLRLAAPQKEAKTLLDQMNVSLFDQQGKIRPLVDVFEDLQRATADMTDEERGQTLATIAGDRAFAKLGGVLMSNLDIVRQWQAALKEQGSLDEAYRKKLETLSGQWNRLKGSVMGAAVSVGDNYLPNVVKLVGNISETVWRMAEWIQMNEQTVKTITNIVFAIGGTAGLIYTVGSLMKAVVALKTMLLLTFSPTGAIIAGVLALVGVIALLSTKFNESKTNLTGYTNAIERQKTKAAELAKEIDTLRKTQADYERQTGAANPIIEARRIELEKLNREITELEGKKAKLEFGGDAPKTLDEINKRIDTLNEKLARTLKARREAFRDFNIPEWQGTRYDKRIEQLSFQLKNLGTLNDKLITDELNKKYATVQLRIKEALAAKATADEEKRLADGTARQNQELYKVLDAFEKWEQARAGVDIGIDLETAKANAIQAARLWTKSFGDEVAVAEGKELPAAISTMLSLSAESGIKLSKLSPEAAKAFTDYLVGPSAGNEDYLRKRADELAQLFGEEYRAETERILGLKPSIPADFVGPPDPEKLFPPDFFEHIQKALGKGKDIIGKADFNLEPVELRIDTSALLRSLEAEKRLIEAALKRGETTVWIPGTADLESVDTALEQITQRITDVQTGKARFYLRPEINEEDLALTTKKLEDMAEVQGIVQSQYAKDVVKIWRRAFATIHDFSFETFYSPMHKFFSQTLKDGRNFSDAWTDMWRGIRDSFLDIVSDMIAQFIAKWVASKILTMILSLIPGVGPAAAAASFAGAPAAGGGEVIVGPWGKDVIPVNTQRGETILDRRLTDMLRTSLVQERSNTRPVTFLSREAFAGASSTSKKEISEAIAQSNRELVDSLTAELGRMPRNRVAAQGGTHVTIKTNVATFSQQESLKFARLTTDAVDHHNRKYISKGRNRT